MLFKSRKQNRRSNRSQQSQRRKSTTRRLQLLEKLEDRRLMAVAGGCEEQLLRFELNRRQYSRSLSDEVYQDRYRSGRFESQFRHAITDGWTRDEEVQPPTTLLREDTSRTIIVRNTSPDIPFDRSINPYRGCEHGCVYCFARPTHAYLGLSPRLDFETQLFFKPDAARLLEQELRRPSYQCKVIAMGTNTDPYQQLEKERKITRSILEVLARFNHPVSIVTKSPLVTRDLDILLYNYELY